MIKASELKLGNWILPQHDLDGKYHLVKKLEDKLINDYVEDWYSSIPLTPEIISKGLNMINSPDLRDSISDLIEQKKLYLHQFQNLIFALTGEELEIKELQHA